jgi:hypothetical protein
MCAVGELLLIFGGTIWSSKESLEMNFITLWSLSIRGFKVHTAKK